MSSSNRNVVFISHANPEDNVFAQWLASRLASIGYTVWSDVTHLLGGEPFWDDIETLIRTNAAKLVLVCSKNMIGKIGVKNEVAVALATARRDTLQEFIIPVRIDDVEFSDFSIEIIRINAIDFTPGWASGFSRLTKRLEKDGVPKADEGSRTELRRWSNSFLGVDRDLVREDTPIVSTLLSLLPPYPHVVIKKLGQRQFDPTEEAIAVRGYSVSLNSRNIHQRGEHCIELIEFLTNGFHDGSRLGSGLYPRDAHSAIQQLVDRGIDQFCSGKGLVKTAFSGRSFGYFRSWHEGVSSRVRFTMPVEGSAHGADLCGTSPKYRVHWHYAPQFGRIILDARSGTLSVPIIAHIVFTVNGIDPIDDSSRAHRLRRTYCKSWWQDRWRNLLLAYLSYISAGEATLLIPVSSEGVLIVGAKPLIFTAVVSARPPHLEQTEDDSWIMDADSLLDDSEMDEDIGEDGANE
ncbi:MAG: toll/interleukin-1 receptor domain-containing protein [bacterium]|nr:toll/interleukin-1 receptor domain-containing protein [bacterium]